MELRKTCRKLTTALSQFWHREAGPMNWKNPVRVTAYIGWEIFNGAAFLVGEWVRYGVRASQIFLAIPPTVILFCGGGWFAVWSFVRRPFPAFPLARGTRLAQSPRTGKKVSPNESVLQHHFATSNLLKNFRVWDRCV